jgi:hypothetical protein
LELIPTNRDSNIKKYKAMKVNVETERFTVPVAFVTKNRQRIKQYNGTTVYLNNGDEFEIELFNPTINKVMAKIDLNGISIGPGVVLRPGERVFLERYLSEAKKFLYSTYEVDGDNSDVQKAIANNGDVAIKFYSEYIPPQPIVTWNNPWWSTTITSPPSWCGNTLTTNNGNYSYNSPLKTSGMASGQSSSIYNMSSSLGTKGRKFSKKIEPQSFASGAEATMGSECLFDCSVDYAPEEKYRGIVDTPKSVETGRIEKGSNSNQSFGYDHSTFYTFWSWKSEWKILPMSQKPIMREDIVLYCTKCQRKRRKDSDIFCPKCGTKY